MKYEQAPPLTPDEARLVWAGMNVMLAWYGLAALPTMTGDYEAYKE